MPGCNKHDRKFKISERLSLVKKKKRKNASLEKFNFQRVRKSRSNPLKWNILTIPTMFKKKLSERLVE